MSIIRLLEGEEFEEYVRQSLDAYPVMFANVTPESKKTWIENMRGAQSEHGLIHYYGVFKEGKMVGGARYHDFEINLHGTIVNAGGIGNVFVDLLHRKEHVSKELMEHFHAHYREMGAPIAVLYPFRPDFYRKMGYGYGRKLNQYRVRPWDLPSGDKRQVEYLTPADTEQAMACYNRYATAVHGMILKPKMAVNRMLQRNKVIGYRHNGQIEGIARIKFDKIHDDNPLLQSLTVNYLVYESPEALHAIIAFLRSQLDQVDRIIFETQDDDLHLLPADPRDGDPYMFYTCQQTNRQALGIMYRVLNTRHLFEVISGHDFNGETLRLRLIVSDSFLPENDGSTIIRFKDGKLTILDDGEYDVEVAMNVEWFSTLMMGVVDFRTLWTYRLATVSDSSYVDALDRLFHSREKPITMEEF